MSAPAGGVSSAASSRRPRPSVAAIGAKKRAMRSSSLGRLVIVFMSCPSRLMAGLHSILDIAPGVDARLQSGEDALVVGNLIGVGAGEFGLGNLKNHARNL